MLSIVSTALVATAAFMPGAEALSAKSSSSTKDGETTTHNSPTVHRKEHRTHSSTVHCSASATSAQYSDSADAFASAVTEAIVKGCSDDDPYWPNKVRDAIKDKDEGFAFAYAKAVANAECVSTGNAYGCAAAFANAKAWAKAVIVSYADAFALGINKCKCDGKRQKAVAKAAGSAKEVKRIMAKVEAEADAHVCVSGDDEAIAHAASLCIQDITATAFAKSISKAMISGQCGYKGLDADAKIKAEATIDEWEYVFCGPI